MSPTKFLAGLALVAAPALPAAEIIDLELSVAQKMCSVVACVNVAAGKVGIYRNPFLKNPLAYATLAEDTDLAGVSAPAGAKITFAELSSSDYYGANFELTLPEAREVGGVEFAAGKPIGYGRFRQIWDPVAKEHRWIPKAGGAVRVKGTLGREETIEGVTLAPKFTVFDTTVANLQGGVATNDRLAYGTAARRSVLPATRPIVVQPGDYLTFGTNSLNIQNARLIEPEGYHVRTVTYYRDSGAIGGMDLLSAATIDGVQVIGDVGFHANGRLHTARPVANVAQVVDGIHFDGAITYYGDLEFHENGTLLTAISTDVAANAANLPADLVAQLPAKLSATRDRLQFFLNPAGRVRAVVVELSKHPATGHWKATPYVANEVGGQLQFTAITDPQDALGRLLLESTRGYVEPKLVDYLKSH